MCFLCVRLHMFLSGLQAFRDSFCEQGLVFLLSFVLKGKNKSYLALKHGLDPYKNVSGSKAWFRSIGKCVILQDYCYYD